MAPFNLPKLGSFRAKKKGSTTEDRPSSSKESVLLGMVSRTRDPGTQRLSGNLRLLTPEEVKATSPNTRELLERGYTVIRGAFSGEDIDALRADVDRVYLEVKPDRSIGEMECFRHRMLCHSALCQEAVAKPAILDVIKPLLGEDCHVIANTAWKQAPQAQNYNAWHTDAGPHVPLPDGVKWPREIPHPVFAVAAHIFLEDCPREAGPTGVIPYSHLSGRSPPQGLKDEDINFEGHTVDATVAERGDIALFVSDLWHRRLDSGDKVGRYFLQVHYGRRDIAQRLWPTHVRNHLSKEAYDRAMEAEDRVSRTIVGLHAPYFYDG